MHMVVTWDKQHDSIVIPPENSIDRAFASPSSPNLTASMTAPMSPLKVVPHFIHRMISSTSDSSESCERRERSIKAQV